MRPDPQAWAAGLGALSFILAIGWAWLKKRQKRSSWPVVAEQWLRSTARFFYFVGLPYLALVSGILTTRLLGLKGLDYFGMIGVGPESSVMADLQYAVVLMFLEWFVDSSRTILVGLAALVILGTVWLGLARTGVNSVAGAFPSLLEVIYYGLHWSFYRAIFWLITGDLYLGVVLGVVLVILEDLFMARLAGNWSARQPQLLTNGMILILTATVFYYSPNLWLLWPVHWAMVALPNFISNLNRSKPILSGRPGRR